jgi:L,D-transpeptidase-like protein
MLCGTACERDVSRRAEGAVGGASGASLSAAVARAVAPHRTGALDVPSGQPPTKSPANATPALPTVSALPVHSAASALPALPSKRRAYIKNRFVFVRPRPDVHADWLGFLWFGASVELRGTEPGPVRGPGCATFYAIEPMGFVCVDEKQATLSADDPVFKAVSAYAPQLARAEPHRYAESLGVALTPLVPDAPAAWPTWPKLPAFFHEPRRHLLPLSTLAYVDEQSKDGQSWLLSADLLWLKKDQVALYPEIAFHGVQLGAELHLPLAFFRREGARKFRRSGTGKFEPSDASFALHEVVGIAEPSEVQRGQRYLKTAAGDDWVREQDAVLPTPRSLTPWGARVGQEDHTGRGPKNPRQTWIEASVLGGWLLAFEGTKPVYATLISAGRGGIPQEGKNTLEISATPVGTFPISGKLATVTLEAPGEYVHSEVPWTQNFQKPYAIHTAYWHNNWGNLASAGCINVSPMDGKWLFDFSEPKLPLGWHAVRWQPATGAPTLLVVHE